MPQKAYRRLHFILIRFGVKVVLVEHGGESRCSILRIYSQQTANIVTGKLYGKNHIWLPPAVRHSAAHFGTFKEEYACDVAFVGSNGDGYPLHRDTREKKPL